MKLFNKTKRKNTREIDLLELKNEVLFTKIDAGMNELGFSVEYLRVPGGVIRTLVNNTSISQIFIPLP